MMTRRFASITLGLAAVFFSTSSSARAALFDFTGTTVSATMQLNGGTYSSGPFTITDDGSALFQFMAAGNTPSVSMTFDNEGSPYLFSDRQAVLNIVTFANEATIQAGFSFTITGLFASEAIGGFEFVDGYDAGLLIGALATSYNAQTGTLVIISNEDINIPDMINLTAQGRFLAIPEPASASAAAGFAAIAALALRRKGRR